MHPSQGHLRSFTWWTKRCRCELTVETNGCKCGRKRSPRLKRSCQTEAAMHCLLVSLARQPFCLRRSLSPHPCQHLVPSNPSGHLQSCCRIPAKYPCSAACMQACALLAYISFDPIGQRVRPGGSLLFVQGKEDWRYVWATPTLTPGEATKQDSLRLPSRRQPKPPFPQSRLLRPFLLAIYPIDKASPQHHHHHHH